MASGTGGSGISGKRGSRGARPYRKYRPLPAIAMLSALCLVAAVVWLNVAIDHATIDDDISCHPEPRPKAGITFTPVPRGALDGVEPLPPAKMRVQVLNASKALGQAARTTDRLAELGFTELAKPANDPAYKGRIAECRGQIRFGPNGKAAARTLSLLEPCFELVRTNRTDAGVNFVLGAGFRGIELTDKRRKALRQLKSGGGGAQPSAGGERAARGNGSGPSAELISAIRNTSC